MDSQKIYTINQESHLCNDIYLYQLLQKYKDIKQLTIQQQMLFQDQGSNQVHFNRQEGLSNKELQTQKKNRSQLLDLIRSLTFRQKLENYQLSLFQRIYQKLLIPIEPSNPFLIAWNFIQILIILHTFIAIPLYDVFDQQFAQSECLYISPLLLVEALCLVADILIQFNVEVLKQGELLHDKQEIAKFYIQNGFIYDIIALIALFTNRFHQYSGKNCQPSGQDLFLQLIKYGFFLKYQSLKKLITYFKHKLYYDSILRSYLELMELLILLVFFAHLASCLWIFVAVYSLEEYKTNWIVQQHSEQSEPITIYLQSLYFSCMTMTTVGYGDIHPTNSKEYILAIILMVIYQQIYSKQLFSCGLFGYTLNTMNTILYQVNHNNQTLHQDIQVIENYMKQRNIDFTIQSRVNNYLKCLHHSGFKQDEHKVNAVTSKLNFQLQQELIYSDKSKMFQDTPFFTKFSQSFQMKLIDKIQELKLPPGELLKNFEEQTQNLSALDKSYIFVQQGLIDIIPKNQLKQQLSKIVTLKTSDSYGINNLLGQFDQNSGKYSLISRGFTIIYFITKADFDEILYDQSTVKEDSIHYLTSLENMTQFSQFSDLKIRCPVCQENGHTFSNCDKLFFRPLKSLVMAKYEFYRPNKRYVKKRKIIKSQHTLKDLKKIQTSIINNPSLYQLSQNSEMSCNSESDVPNSSKLQQNNEANLSNESWQVDSDEEIHHIIQDEKVIYNNKSQRNIEEIESEGKSSKISKNSPQQEKVNKKILKEVILKSKQRDNKKIPIPKIVQIITQKPNSPQKTFLQPQTPSDDFKEMSPYTNNYRHSRIRSSAIQQPPNTEFDRFHEYQSYNPQNNLSVVLKKFNQTVSDKLKQLKFQRRYPNGLSQMSKKQNQSNIMKFNSKQFLFNKEVQPDP